MSLYSTLRGNVFVRLGVYYASWIVVVVILYRAFPIIPEYMDAERARHIRSAVGFIGSDEMDIPSRELRGRSTPARGMAACARRCDGWIS